MAELSVWTRTGAEGNLCHIQPMLNWQLQASTLVQQVFFNVFLPIRNRFKHLLSPVSRFLKFEATLSLLAVQTDKHFFLSRFLHQSET